MNPSPWGGFAEGVARGMSGGMDTYVRLALTKIDQQQRSDQANAEMNYKLFSDKNMPIAIRKKAYTAWQKTNKAWNTGLGAENIPDEMWEDQRLNSYFQRGQKILNNKDYSMPDKIKFLAELEAEAISIMGGVASGVFKPLSEQAKTGALKLGVGGLGEGKLTPETIGLLSESKTGRGMLAERVKPIRKKTPAIPLYETMEIGNGKTQKMKWNPTTNKHDIPYGEPVQGAKSSYHRIGSTIYEFKDGKSKEMQKGNLKEQAVIHAMREKEWQYLDETEQYELIEKHMRLLQGMVNPLLAPPTKDLSLSTSGRKGLVGGVLDRFFPKQAESLGLGIMGKEKDALLSKQKKPIFHKVKRNTPLTKEIALKILRAARGDKALARKMAKEQGYSF